MQSLAEEFPPVFIRQHIVIQIFTSGLDLFTKICIEISTKNLLLCILISSYPEGLCCMSMKGNMKS